MKSFTSLTSLAACISLLGAAAAQDILSAITAAVPEIKFCGSSLWLFQDTTFDCVDDFLLCPVVAGFKYKRCGTTCFSDLQYNCTADKVLQELPQLDKPYQVAVLSPSLDFLNGQIVNAVGARFVVGQQPYVDCPPPRLGDCQAFKNITGFAGLDPGAVSGNGVALMASTPGGQQAKIQKGGRFGYSVPHSAYTPGGTFPGPGVFRAYKNGEFIYTGSKGWRACLVDDKGTIDIFAVVHGYDPKGLCVEIKLVTKDPGVPPPYAWTY